MNATAADSPTSDPVSAPPASAPPASAPIVLVATRAQAPADLLRRLTPRLKGNGPVALFFTGAGTRLANHPFPGWPIVQRVVCAHAYEKNLGAPPPPDSGLIPGGLALLGALIRASRIASALPHLAWPEPIREPGPRNVAVCLAECHHPSETEEALRVAVGLAACGCRLTVYLKSTTAGKVPPPGLSAEGAAYWEALSALQAVIKAGPAPETAAGPHQVTLRI